MALFDRPALVIQPCFRTWVQHLEGALIDSAPLANPLATPKPPAGKQ